MKLHNHFHSVKFLRFTIFEVDECLQKNVIDRLNSSEFPIDFLGFFAIRLKSINPVFQILSRLTRMMDVAYLHFTPAQRTCFFLEEH